MDSSTPLPPSPTFSDVLLLFMIVTLSGAGSAAIETLMVGAGKALDSADASRNPTGVDEEDKTDDGSPATSTTTSPATPAAATASIDTSLEIDSRTGDAADTSIRNARLQESFRTELELYASGNQVDVCPCYASFEAVFRNPEVREMDQGSRNSLMLMLMSSIEGETRH